jgi:hypothetical protein
VIRGFVTQATWTAIRWLEAERSKAIICEGREDIDHVVFDAVGTVVERVSEQIKDVTGSLSARSQEVYETLFGFMVQFYEGRENTSRYRFVFSTSADLSRQQLQEGTAGELPIRIIDTWKAWQEKRDAALPAQLSDGLGRLIALYCKDEDVSSGEPAEGEQGAPSAKSKVRVKFTKADVHEAFRHLQEDDAALQDFLDSVLWNFGQESGEALLLRLEQAVATDSRTRHLPHRDFSRRLVYDVLRAASQRSLSERRLTWERLEEVAKITHEELRTWRRSPT